MNKIASFYPVLLNLDQNSTLYAYSIFVKIPPCTLIRACTLIRETRVVNYAYGVSKNPWPMGNYWVIQKDDTNLHQLKFL